ncbi:MAG: hypothetical protein DBY29_07530 [Coprobacillus sp.]|nr:MAG: hypothetical protein DBY29_07530 [Coprobacillus sp.]
MKKIVAFLSALVLILGLIQVSVPAADNNLINNGDFETAKSSYSTSSAKYWTGSNYTRVSDPTGSGQGYVMRVNGASGARSCNHDSITVKASTYYCYSAKIYRQDATGPAYIDMLPAAGGNYLAGSQVGTNETGKWVTVSCIFNSGEHTTVEPHLATSGTTSGKYIYFDDVVLTELAFPQIGTIDTPRAQFSVSTDSTAATFAATDNGLYITSFTSYITQPQEISLVKRISDKEITWVFNSYEAIAITNGIAHRADYSPE